MRTFKNRFLCALLAASLGGFAVAPATAQGPCDGQWDRYLDSTRTVRESLENLRASFMERSRLEPVEAHHLDLLVFELRTKMLNEALLLDCLYLRGGKR